MNTIPYLRVVVGASLLAVAGYGIFSAWAVFSSTDAALRGDVIGTWKSFAVLAFGFWLGSSSGGKAAGGGQVGPNENVTVNPEQQP
jgi:hypothetical protein